MWPAIGDTFILLFLIFRFFIDQYVGPEASSRLDFMSGEKFSCLFFDDGNFKVIDNYEDFFVSCSIPTPR